MKKRITDTVRLDLLEGAQAAGWKVYAYSEYTEGVPAYAEIEKFEEVENGCME